MLKRWEGIEKDYPRAKAEFASKHAEWEIAAKKAKAEGKQPPPEPFNPDWNDARQFPAGQHLQRRAQADDRLRHPRRHLVSGRIECGEGVSVSRPVPAHDQELAGRVGPRRFFVLLGAAC